MTPINRIYQILLHDYGPQGWWPLLTHQGTNPTKTGSISGYHPGDDSFPHNERERFEICLGAILTQNTAWTNVEKALLNLEKLQSIDPKKILILKKEKLLQAIRPAGYFNQKARKIEEFAKFYNTLNTRTPSREQLLSVWGIGPETCDSILLYAYNVPTFVVDAYTRRIFLFLGLIEKEWKYEKIQQLFENSLARDSTIFQEYHALLVEHAKRHYKKEPYGCPLQEHLKKGKQKTK